MADGRSVIGIIILCASLGATLEIEASGPDEREAVKAVDEFFAPSDDSGDDPSGLPGETASPTPR